MKEKLVSFSSLFVLGCNIGDAQEQKPNFLFFITDDQTYESIHALNNSEIETPNLDRLVRQGTTFTHAFNQGSWSGAVSVASRCMLITGQHVHKAYKNDSYLDGWARIKHEDPETAVPLWGEVFRNAGYHTFITGKWHNSNESLLSSFSEAHSVGSGFNESETPDGKKLQYHRGEPSETWMPSDKRFGGHWTPLVKDIIEKEGKRVVTPFRKANRHSSEIYGDEAIRFLQHQSGEKPFFMYVAFNAPHDPRQSPQRFVEKYPMDNLKLPANFLPEHPFDQGDAKVRDEVLAPFPRTPEAIRLHRQEYYAIITHADEVVGRILDELEHAGLDDNTYIIFTSDHGLAVGSHGLMGKQNLYDHTVRVPLIFKGPSIKKNLQVDEKVYMQSVYATTCDLAGIAIPETVDFSSLKPLLEGNNAKGEEYIYGSYRHFQRMVRSDHYKLILYPKAKRIQLFDIETDPYETKNLARDKHYKKIVKELFNVLKRKQIEFEDTLELGKITDYFI